MNLISVVYQIHYKMSRTRRNFSAKFKSDLVIELLKGEKDLNTLAAERKEKEAYAKKVGQLTMQVDWLKKKSEEVLGPDYESKFSPKPFED